MSIFKNNNQNDKIYFCILENGIIKNLSNEIKYFESVFSLNRKQQLEKYINKLYNIKDGNIYQIEDLSIKKINILQRKKI